jgi:hypothetical protein
VSTTKSPGRCSRRSAPGPVHDRSAVLAQQLNRNTALFLSAATFELEGETQSQEVELQIATSGHYTNQPGQNVFRFVSQPVSTTNDGPGLPQ